MKFYPVDELKTMPESIIGSLTAIDEAVITEGGKPAAIMLKVSNDNFDEMIQVIRQVKAMISFDLIRKKSAENGYMTDDEINAEIAAARRGE